MVKFDEREIRAKGRVGPGQSIAVDLNSGKFYGDEEVKDMLAGRHDYAAWTKRIVEIDRIIKTDAPEPVLFQGEELRRRQLGVGMTLEELEMILHPMVEDGAEAVGSMGDDTPVAVLSARYRGLHHYFRQAFSQVTNPPIDSLRESRVMTIKTRLGNLGNVLDENAEQCDLLQLDSPVLSTAEFAAMREFMGAHVCVIDCTVAIEGDQLDPPLRDRAHPAGGGGRRARRVHPHHRDGRAPGARPRADPDDPGDRGDSHASDAAITAHLHQPEHPLRRVRRRPQFRRADRRGGDHDQRLSRAGEHRRPPPPGAVRRHHARIRGAQVQEGGRQGPAEDDVEDGHLRDQLVSRWL